VARLACFARPAPIRVKRSLELSLRRSSDRPSWRGSRRRCGFDSVGINQNNSRRRRWRREKQRCPSLLNSCSFSLHCGGSGVWARNNFGWNCWNKGANGSARITAVTNGSNLPSRDALGGGSRGAHLDTATSQEEHPKGWTPNRRGPVWCPPFRVFLRQQAMVAVSRCAPAFATG